MLELLHQIWTKLLEPRSLRFLLVGMLGALSNILILLALVDLLHLETIFLKSVANIIATEICLVASFFSYRQFVWQIKTFDWRSVLRSELLNYHISIASVISIRSLLLFPFMDWLGLEPAINTVIGVGIGAVLTYTLSEKFIFSAKIPIH